MFVAAIVAVEASFLLEDFGRQFGGSCEVLRLGCRIHFPSLRIRQGPILLDRRMNSFHAIPPISERQNVVQCYLDSLINQVECQVLYVFANGRLSRLNEFMKTGKNPMVELK
jgi:hypothetical protein